MTEPAFPGLTGELRSLCRAIWKRGPVVSNRDLALDLDWCLNDVSRGLTSLVSQGRLLRRNQGGQGLGRELLLLDPGGEVVPPCGQDPRGLPQRRRCLGGCGRRFLSSWAGHRICDACKERQRGVSPYAPNGGR